MVRKAAFLLFSFVLPLTCQSLYAREISNWTSRAFNMAECGHKQWQWPDAAKIAGFYPLGISANGWFAHASSLDGTEVTLANLDFQDGCLTDTPEQDICGCLFNAGPEDLIKFGVEPFKDPQKGTFPVRLLDDEYDVEIIYREKAIYSISRIPGKKNAPEFPGSLVFLVSKRMGKKQIGLIDHNHMQILPGARPAGWIKSPSDERIIVLILCGRDYEGTGLPASYDLVPFGTYLKTGFGK